MAKRNEDKPVAIAAPGLEVVTVPVDRLHPNPWNPNVQDDRTYQAERESIRTFGFIDPVTARSHPTKGRKLVGLDGTGWSDTDWQTIDGEHRWRAAKDEGYTDIAVISLGQLGDVAARKLTIILNETRGEADVAKLGALLADLQKEVPDVGELLTGLPFTGAELENLVGLGEVDWDQFEQSPPPPPPSENGLVAVSFEMTQAQADALPNLVLMLQREWEQTSDGAAVYEAVARACKTL